MSHSSQLVSPDDMMAAAKQHMLENREPDSQKDWVLIVNFLATNILEDVRLSAVKLMCSIYEIPLSDSMIEDIVTFHGLPEAVRKNIVAQQKAILN